MRMESLEIRALLAANTLDFVDNLEIGSPSDKRDLQLEVDPSSGTAIVALRIQGTSGDLDPAVPLVFIQDTDRTNPANHVQLLQAMADSNGSTDSLVMFEVSGGANFTIEVGGTSGSGGFLAEVMLFGSTDADGSVSENEYMRAVAAELQARGAGNHNTAAYFQTVYGINFNQSQYNPAFDANMNGQVDGWEVGYIESNMGGASVVLDLIGDNEAPAVEAAVAVDTGSSTTDNITMDTTGIVGTVTDFSTIVRAEVSIQGGTGGSIDLADPANLGTITALTQGANEITFTLDIDDLNALLGSGTVLNTGSYTLEVTTEDELGNTSITPFTLDFEFDTDAPAQPSTPDLEDTSDSGDSNTDNLTNVANPDISVVAEEGSTVTFFSDINGNIGSAVAGAGGLASITSKGLSEGTHDITAIATDVAGNESNASAALSITIDTTPASDVEDIVLTNVDLNDILTFDNYAAFTGKTEADATVQLLDSNSQVVATTTADGTTGEFAFVMGDNISLELGENNFWFVATDVAANPSAKVAFDVFRNNPPTIDDPGLLSVDENSPMGTPIVTIVADSGDDNTDTLTYKIKSVDAGYESTFAINSATGAITVNDPAKLDFEDDSMDAVKSFELVIEVTDSKGDGAGEPGLSTTRTITIDLNDVNESPVFDEDPFTLTVEENSGMGVELDGGPISATDVDADDDEAGDLSYTITGGDGMSLFEIDEFTGVVTVKAGADLDYEMVDSYSLEITVTDNLDGDGNGEVGIENSVMQTVTVNLIDVNETPEFVNDPFNFQVREDATTPLSIGFVEVSDVDIDDQITGSLTYEITPATDDGLFAIDSETGEITLTALGAATLDFETATSYSLDIEVTDSVDTPGGEVGGTFTIMTTVTIDVLDVNEAPTFDQSPFEFTLLEDAANNAVVGEITATDLDADDDNTDDLTGDLRFAIVEGDHSDYFEIDPISGVITVTDNSVFDFEEVDGMKSFTLDVTVTDNLDGEGQGELGEVKVVNGTVNITLTNVNELPDEDTVDLGQITFELVNDGSDSANTGKMVVLTDPDADDFIDYTETFDALNHFSIDASGNLVFNTANPVTQQQLDDASGTIDFSIMVPINDQNGGMKTIEVTFQVVENAPPVFQSPAANSSYDVVEFITDDPDNLDETTPIDDTLDIQATDPDSDPVDQPIADNGFSLGATTAYPNVDLAGLFEITTINGNRTIVVKDGSEALLRYDLVVVNGATAGTAMIEGVMTDVATFTINIVATDPLGGVTELPIEIRVINRNDVPTFEAPATNPMVEEQVVSADPLSNNIVPGTPVYDLFEAFSDPDNFDGDMDHLSYQIVASTYSAAFEIGGVIPGTETYQLVVSDPSILDYETLALTGDTTIELEIIATDADGEMVTGKINIDVEPQNELPIYDMIAPIEFDYDFLLGQDEPAQVKTQAEVFAGQPADPEGDTLTYTQRGPETPTMADDEFYFSLDSNGNIVLENEILFGNEEEERTFVLNFDYGDDGPLTTTDLGFAEGAFQLTIVVSKNQAPTFESNDSFNVDENATGNGEVLLIQVDDPEMEDITFSLSDPQNAFSLTTVDAKTGNGSFATASLKLDNGANLDHEALTDGKYELTVTATDEYGRMTTQTITVNVNDVNEAPVFTSSDTFSVPENSVATTLVDTVTVTDEDEDDIPGTNLTFAITGGTGQGIFAIDGTSGEITVVDPSALDAEDNSKNSYTLEVSVTDNLDGVNENGIVETSIQTITINVTDVNEAPVKIANDPGAFLVDETDFPNVSEGDTFEERFDIDVSAFFEDPEMNDILLTVDMNFDIDTPDFTAGGHIISATFDNVNDQLVVVFEYFGVDQNRAPVEIQLIAAEDTLDALEAVGPLSVTIEVTNETSVDFKIIPVLNPTVDDTEGFDGVTEGNLPQATTRFADEQTFFVEVWGTTLVGMDDVAAGNAWAEGFRTVILQMNYRDDLVDLIDVVNPKAFLGDEGSGANGLIEEFNAFFGVVGEDGEDEDDIVDDEPPFAGFGSIGGDGSYVRIGYLQFQAKQGIEEDNIADLVEIDFTVPGTDVVLNGADQVDVGQGANSEIGIPRTGDIQADIDMSQITLTNTTVEIVDAEMFTISSANSEAIINVFGASTIDGLDIQGQGGNGVGNVTSFTGNIYVLFSGSETDPDSFEIIGSELILTNDTDGPFGPGEPEEPGDLPDGTSTDDANFGLEAFEPEQNLPTQVAVRETVIRIGGMPEVTFGQGDDAYNSEVSFDSSGFAYGIVSGVADTVSKQPFQAGSIEFAGRSDLSGVSLNSNGAETSTIEGDSNGGYVLTLNLSRLIQETFTLQQVTSNIDLSFSGTIVATTGGAVPLQGTVFAKDGQPLEDGSGMFVTVNKTRTGTDENGQVAELPDSADWASEWDTLWVEVWGNTADADGVLGGSLDLAYDTSLFTATQIEYAASMTANRTGSIDDANGMITGLGSQSEQTDLGNGQFVLLGRVKLESLPNDGIDVSVGGDLSAESLGLVATNTKIVLSGIGQVDPDVTDVAEVDVWAVAYDANDDGTIGISDFSQFISAYGSSTLTADDAMLAALDFDNNGTVGLRDFSAFIKNYGLNKSTASEIVYPETFTQMWVGKDVELNGPNSVQEVFDKAVSDWQEALGWEEPIDVKLVVTDFGDAQLGEAELLGLDENGLPQFGILTLDDDGAGLGWSADLEGGPSEGQYDLYTVILHELGHLYGFMSHYSGFADNVVTDHEGNKIFIGADFVATLDDYAHHLDSTEHMGDVMNATLDPGQRKLISALDVQILQTAYDSATAGQALTGGSVALHAAVTTETVVEETIVAPVVTPEPVSFVFDKVVDVESVSGRTGYEAAIAPAIYDELIRNGVRVTTSSSTEVKQQIEALDSAVATLASEDTSLLLADSVEDADYFTTEEDSTSVDDLFADWDFNSDLEG